MAAVEQTADDLGNMRQALEPDALMRGDRRRLADEQAAKRIGHPHRIGGFLGATLGVGFGGLIGWGFPEFVALICHPTKVEADVAPSIGAAMGMISGLFIGAALPFFFMAAVSSATVL